MITKNYCFSLSDTQYAKLKKWYNEIIIENKLQNCTFGAIGGELTFEITPTSIGTFITAKFMGKKLDISEV